MRARVPLAMRPIAARASLAPDGVWLSPEMMNRALRRRLAESKRKRCNRKAKAKR